MKWLSVLAAVLACSGEKSKHAPKVYEDARVDVDASGADAVVENVDDFKHELDNLAPVGKPPPARIRKFARGDCRTAYAPRPDRDPNPMCRVTGGTFRMGGTLDKKLHPAISSADPPREVTVGDYDIDQFEVTVEQAVHFLNAHGNRCGDDKCVNFLSEISEVGDRFEVVAKRGQSASFSVAGAISYCAWVGKVVPTSAEQEYAARHDPKTGKDLIYPWGDVWDPRRANCLWGVCIERSEVVGSNDGTRGSRDGSSPWGVHDCIDKGSEMLFDCDKPTRRCEWLPCTCKVLGSVSGQDNAAAYVTYARIDGSNALRCVRLR